MKRARFFRVLHLARVLKEHGYSKERRWSRLYWYRCGLLDAWLVEAKV